MNRAASARLVTCELATAHLQSPRGCYRRFHRDCPSQIFIAVACKTACPKHRHGCDLAELEGSPIRRGRVVREIAVIDSGLAPGADGKAAL
jgi:hypothetical protein